MDCTTGKAKKFDTDKTKALFQITTVAGFAAIGVFILYGLRTGIFTSRDVFSAFILGLGFFAPVCFVAIQAVQVVIPILPGAVGCVVGVIAFGPVMGFIYNYIGICIGSVAAFLISKRFGLPTVRKLVNEKSLDKYIGWLDKGSKFDIMFAVAIFLPVAPDDLLCFLAGLTNMSLKKFTWIILLGKPLSILLYSLGLESITRLFGI